MRPNKIKQSWAQGRPVTMGWLAFANSFTAEIMARQGFDALCIDMQHGVTSESSLLEMLQAISATDTVPVVRVAKNDPAAIMKALDWGAYGIVVPLINTAADAVRAVSACRYPPLGTRSYGPVRAIHYGGADYPTAANDELLVMAMIETKEGLANLEEICGTNGLDAIYIGPADLSLALGLPPRMDNPDSLHIETCHRIRDTARHQGKKVCMHCASGVFAADAIRRGFDLVVLTSDMNAMVAGARRQIDEFNSSI